MQHIHDLASLLTEEQLSQLQPHLSLHQYAKNEVIYLEGDYPEYLYCLVSGKVKVYKDGVGGRAQIVRVAQEGEYFGYRAFFAHQNYITAAAAFELTHLCKIPMSLLQKWMETNTSLSQFFIQKLAIRLGESDQRTVSLTQKHVRGRLADALIFLYQNYGVEADGVTLAIHPSREDIANLSNMTTSNAIRTLSAFAAEQIIHVNGRVITLLDTDRLQHISRLG